MKIISYSTHFFSSQAAKLFGKVYLPKDTEPVASVFIVPGFSQLGTKRYIELQKDLAHRSVSSFVFDYTGIGQSKGNINQTKVSDLINDTRSAFSVYIDKLPCKNLFIVGYCIGSYNVLRVLDEVSRVTGIILVSPPAYSDKVDNLCLDSSTVEFVRSASYDKNSKVYASLANYKKRALVIFGDNDKEIPSEIKCRYKNIKSRMLKHLNIPGGKHSLLKAFSNLEIKAKNTLLHEVYKFIEEDLQKSTFGKRKLIQTL